MYHNPQTRQNRFRIDYRCVSILVLAFLILVQFMTYPGAIFAETPAAPIDPSNRLTVESLQKRIDEVERSKELDDATKTSILTLYREAVQDAIRAAFWFDQSQSFRQKEKSAAENIQQAKTTLAKSGREFILAVSPVASLQELEEELTRAEAALNVAKENLTTMEMEPRRRAIRRREIESLMKEARTRVTSLELQQEALASAKEKPTGELGLAQEMRLQAALEMSLAEIEGYTQELAAQRATTDLLPLQHDLATREVTRAKAAVEELKKRVSLARQQEADEQVREAQQRVAIADPALKAIAEENTKLALYRQEIIKKTRDAAETLSKQRQELAKIDRDFKGVQDQLKSVGRTKSIASFLKTQRIALPDTHGFRESIESRQPQIYDAQTEIIELAEKRAYLAGKEESLALEEEEEKDFFPTEVEEVRLQAERDLIQTQKKYVDRLAREYNRYFNTLVELETTEQELVANIENYRDYIDGQVLWIRSSLPIWDSINWQVLHDGRTLLREGFGSRLLESLIQDAKNNSLLWCAAFFVLLTLILLRRRAVTALCELGQQAETSVMQHFLPTAQAALLTILLTIPVLGILFFLAWRMSGLSEPIRSIGIGLWTTTILFFPLDFFRQVCRPCGLAERHFEWPPSGVTRIRSRLFKLILLTFPLVLVAAVLNSLPNVKWQDTIGRTCFMVSLLITATIMHFLLRRHGEVFRVFLAMYLDRWISKAFLVGYLLAVLFPLMLLIVAGLGYYFTAWHLASRWLETVLFILTLLIVGAFLFRWILVVRRRLAINRARQKREEMQAAVATEIGGGEAGEVKVPPLPDIGPDLETINKQVRRLLFVVLGFAGACGIWLIWDDVVPALGILKYVPLWSVSGGGPLEISHTITLADFAWAIVIAALTFIAARNIPGLLEMSLLHSLPIDKGLRYAITTVSRYLLIAIGIIWACSHVGLGWSKVQWILAAMSVGLGFGLQEIFANFVSGMVILFERPIRIGDIITIGDASGRVTKIQMRATTILDWDKKELVVPNKEFTTGRLLNWTLTDTVNRLVIDVGVSYDSDPDQVRAILLQCAAEHPKVVSSPKPICIFREFTSSAMMFSLRIYLAAMKGRLDVIHEMHTKVHRALREAGIKIAYPQLDLHVRSDLRDPVEKPNVDLPELPAEGPFPAE